MIFIVISAILTSLSMPGFLWGGLIWFSLILFFKGLENKRFTFIYSFLFHFILYFISLYWVIPVLTSNLPDFFGRFSPFTGFLVFLLLCTIEALPFTVFGIFYGYFIDKIKGFLPKAFFVSSIYSIIEFLRGIGEMGFTGIRLSDALYKEVGIIQIVSLVGTIGLTFLVVFVNFTLYYKKISISKIIITLSMIYLFNWLIISVLPTNSANTPLVIVQTNMEQKVKYSKDETEILNYFTNILTSNTPNYLHIFPEAVFPDKDIRNSYIEEKIKMLSIKKPIILGFPTFNDNSKNSAAVYANGMYIGKYDKIKLFPFVEFLPYEKIFKKFQFLKGISYFSKGTDFKVFKINDYPDFGIQICFESYFSEISRKLSKNGAKFLIIISNDGWYKFTTAHIQHFSKSIFRAIENRRYVVQVSNTGISGVIDKYGRIVKIFPPMVEKYGIFNVQPNTEKTVYQRFGDWFVIVLILNAIFIPLIYRKRKNKLKGGKI
ncbi:acyltransferase [Thermosipho melanesiensis]|uniref:Apolipoprotein N-acyltransferase n=2 Tax=Thermosipho melanesiensis TaxID=46541 RepID=A6LP64_THEM4|nr:apolipoprotein N-acyltransferase [Thermosipho melanesiensis]ABR31715.1 apolipoprotein N-acyltransferase [Thermosipho melanesiensis BI429]APT74738.1 acyltransferase [Thermosipho melanesiensis]OOC35240.1 acyltransferase [Thermosipho melanesiensis]OOC35450.1 acyltransferase [Thermosipho melanesiensis]OOC36701.1 acyltransferase [Thermosipho melanesiensis]